MEMYLSTVHKCSINTSAHFFVKILDFFYSFLDHIKKKDHNPILSDVLQCLKCRGGESEQLPGELCAT